MNPKTILALALSAALFPAALRAQETNHWRFDVTLYGLAASMSGDAAVKGIPANNVKVGFDQIWDNLNFAAMGTVRVGYDRWSVSTDVIYMDLEGNSSSLSFEAKQLMVQPVLEYRIIPQAMVFAGAMYNNMKIDLGGPLGLNVSDTQGWWDPVVGSQLSLPLGERFSLNVRGDVGGFSVNSDLVWQAYPYVAYKFARWGSVQLGYRWIYVDYETGSGRNLFKYDMLSQGPQLGITFSF